MSRGRVLLVTVALVANACAGPQAESVPSSERASERGAITNCGFAVHEGEPPERVVSLNQQATEMLLALGLDERMVGTAWLDNPILPDLAEAYERIPVLADGYPSREVLLDREPDFVVAGYESAFSTGAAGARQDLHAAGIGTFLMSEYCANSAETATLDALFDDIRDLAHVFDVPERGDALVEELEEDLAVTEQALAGLDEVNRPRVAYTEAVPVDALFVAGRKGIAHEIIELAGGENAFPDVESQFAEVSYETYVDRDPEIVLVGWYGDNPPEDMRSALLDNRILDSVTGIRNRRMIDLPLADVVSGIRPPKTVRELAEQLHPEAFQ